MNSTRRSFFAQGASMFGTAALATTLLPGQTQAASTSNGSAKLSEKALGEGQLVKLLPDDTNTTWQIDICGVPVEIDSAELHPFVWHKGRWIPVVAVSQFGNKTVLWTSLSQATNGRLREDQIGRHWQDDEQVALFPV